ncbi:MULTISPECIES: gas vesicle protein [Streptomyces]|uniref:Gas vesicle protein n=1 Tax=Streptomyces rochei TaxID=1928 RepID=A0ABW7ECU0_STRRO|nr:MULTISPECIES: gas vesicle protein [Streptomyces]MDV6287422.1 gas vesicle protein [Streptomyces sp. UP1A-1]WDI22415.1 gas vesicle protein [Streptomyces enissocaesilis]MBQ0912743.1 gas vesicle protein [Streptomyces sp. RM99]MBU8553418.1 gas vesicle protein [Streptomyces sp. Osf17]MBU8560210.1 gas vesicle protein [Streptomyces sp. Babs14]
MTEPGERRRGTRSTTTRERSVRGARDAAEHAADALSELIRHRVEGVSAVCRSEDDGWVVNVDVLEVARIPDTTSLLATYEVELDPSGDLLQYRRVARYRRGAQDQ